MALTSDDIKKVGTLARLALSETEIDRYTHQMNDLLNQFERLQELDTDDVPAMSHAVPVAALLRDDMIKPSLPREIALAEGPKTDPWMGGFVVPQVMSE
ncbi:MAG: Asp-tRNA(Asn)/Glu-tRNA(Gln) amidotransferase subunit GatC [Fibrella sp.]|nr:Asp-tRNA(Asn)/Glu-tRNA(Gln) amidotransferase subunit GatC [Armatimonadota bacterium]